MTTSSDDRELVARARRGCAASAAALAARHQVAVVDYAGRLLSHRGGCRADAEDVAQESLVRALRRLDRHDRRRPFKPWLLAITRRRCLNHLRAERRRTARDTARAATDTRTGEDPQAVAAAREESTRLWRIAIRELPERQFSALWLRTVENLSITDVARVLRQPPATVKVLLFRARRRLAAVLPDRDAATPRILPIEAAASRRLRHG